MVFYPMTLEHCSGATCERPDAVTTGAVAPLFDIVQPFRQGPPAYAGQLPLHGCDVGSLPLVARAFSARSSVGNVQKLSTKCHGSRSRGRNTLELWRAFGNADSVEDALRLTLAIRDPSQGGRFMPAEHTDIEGAPNPLRDGSWS